MNSYSNDYTYKICENCKCAACCSAFAIPLTAFDVVRYSLAFNMSPRDFMLKYTVDSFEDMDFIKTNEYLKKSYKYEKPITFLARRTPYINNSSMCIFALFDKESGAVRCATYNCRSYACRIYYAADCMTQYGLYEASFFTNALTEESLITPYFESDYAEGLYKLAVFSYNVREEFKKGCGYSFTYDLKKYQLPIEDKVNILAQRLNNDYPFKDWKDAYITSDMFNYPKDLDKLSKKNYKVKDGYCWDALGTHTRKAAIEENLYLQPVIESYRIEPKDNLAVYNGLRFIDSFVKFFPVLSNEKDNLALKIKVAKLLNLAINITIGDTNKYLKLIVNDLKKDLKKNYPTELTAKLYVKKSMGNQECDGSWRQDVIATDEFPVKVYQVFYQTLANVCELSKNNIR